MNSNEYCIDKSDEELVILTLSDKEYFTCIIEQYEAGLSRYINRLTNISSEDVEDILQDIFIKAYTNLNNFDSSLKFSSWLYRIAHNEVINNYRKNSVRPHGHKAEVEDEVLFNIVADIHIEKDIDTKILRIQLEQSMQKLSPKYQDVLTLRFFEEKDYEEISDILQKPSGTIATLLNRAKKQLQKEFINLGYMKHYE